MQKKNTDDLRQELMQAPNLDRFLSTNREQFSNESLVESLNRLLGEKHISKAAIAKQAGMSEV